MVELLFIIYEKTNTSIISLVCLGTISPVQYFMVLNINTSFLVRKLNLGISCLKDLVFCISSYKTNIYDICVLQSFFYQRMFEGHGRWRVSNMPFKSYDELCDPSTSYGNSRSSKKSMSMLRSL